MKRETHKGRNKSIANRAIKGLSDGLVALRRVWKEEKEAVTKKQFNFVAHLTNI